MTELTPFHSKDMRENLFAVLQYSDDFFNEIRQSLGLSGKADKGRVIASLKKLIEEKKELEREKKELEERIKDLAGVSPNSTAHNAMESLKSDKKELEKWREEALWAAKRNGHSTWAYFMNATRKLGEGLENLPEYTHSVPGKWIKHDSSISKAEYQKLLNKVKPDLAIFFPEMEEVGWSTVKEDFETMYWNSEGPQDLVEIMNQTRLKVRYPKLLESPKTEIESRREHLLEEGYPEGLCDELFEDLLEKGITVTQDKAKELDERLSVGRAWFEYLFCYSSLGREPSPLEVLDVTQYLMRKAEKKGLTEEIPYSHPLYPGVTSKKVLRDEVNLEDLRGLNLVSA